MAYLDSLFTVFMAVIAVTALAGVFSPFYPDTLLQRIGMSVICLGASVELFCRIMESCGNGRVSMVLAGGFAIFGVATTIKHWRKARRARLWRQSLKR